VRASSFEDVNLSVNFSNTYKTPEFLSHLDSIRGEVAFSDQASPLYRKHLIKHHHGIYLYIDWLASIIVQLRVTA
jgi:hypothetical protein